jgi:hypothetical protein
LALVNPVDQSLIYVPGVQTNPINIPVLNVLPPLNINLLFDIFKLVFVNFIPINYDSPYTVATQYVFPVNGVLLLVFIMKLPDTLLATDHTLTSSPTTAIPYAELVNAVANVTLALNGDPLNAVFAKTLALVLRPPPPPPAPLEPDVPDEPLPAPVIVTPFTTNEPVILTDPVATIAIPT